MCNPGKKNRIFFKNFSNTYSLIKAAFFLIPFFISSLFGQSELSQFQSYKRSSPTASQRTLLSTAGANGAVHAIAVSGNDVYIGGDFTEIGGISANRIAKWNSTSNSWSALGSGISSTVLAIAVTSSYVYAGGNFTTSGGVTVNNIARWNGTSWGDLSGGMNNTVWAIAVLGSNIYVGGEFTQAGSIPADRFVRWNGSSWDNSVGSTDGVIRALYPSPLGDDIYIGGSFARAGDKWTANNIARWNNGSWYTMGSGCNSAVYSIYDTGSGVYVGGNFTTVDGLANNHIALWNGASWVSLGSGVTGGNVFAIGSDGTNIYAAGSFTSAGGSSAGYIAKWNGSSWSTMNGGLNSTADAIGSSSYNIFVGGNFTTAGGVEATYIARWGNEWCANLTGTIYVNSSASGNNDGTSWTNAFTSLQSALDVAISSDEIWVAKGAYKPSYAYDLTNSSRYYHFRMKNGVAIYGGFAGTETDVSQRTNFSAGETNETILSGDIGTTEDTSDNCYHVFYHPSGTNLDATAVLDGFIITRSNANGSSWHNTGGGMYNYSSSPAIINSTFISNSAGYGGGMYNYSSSPAITNSTFTSNSASSYGGGLFNSNSSSSTITNSTFAFNSASNGGGVYNNSASPTITNSTFTSNSASSYGGGLFNSNSSSSTITNSTFAFNSADNGGGMHNDLYSSLIINNSIIWGNTATTSGNQFCINNVSTTTLNYSCYSNSVNDFSTLSGTFRATNHNITSSPKFVDAENGDFRLSGDSPAVNAGLNSYNTTSTDIRGQARIQNTTVDMGAYEWTNGMDPVVINFIYYVNASATGSNNGLNWTNAFTSLQSAFNNASSSDQIWVAKGTYKPSYAYDLTNSSRYYHFRMKNGLSIYGGFAGNETAVSQRTDFGKGGTNETVLSGDLDNNWTDDNDCYHVFYHPSGINLDATAVLDGFTITRGNANGNYPHYNGGGMYNNSSSPTVVNSMFASNSAGYGGGMYNYSSSSPTITNSTFAFNSASYGGGGIYNESSSSPTITNSTFTSNSTSTYGGGMYNYSSSPMINNSIIWGNTATTSGNQFYIYSGATTLNYSCYSNNANDVNNNNGTFTATNNNITSNPKFADAANGDYRIYWNSPAVNSGLNSYNTNSTDIRGQARIQNTTIDMGAYEWTTGMDPAGITYYVNASATGNNDGTSWTDAFTSLQSALDVAIISDQIWVAGGTYKPSYAYDLTNTSRYYHLRMKNTVAIYGGFAGTETDVSQRTNFGAGETNETILSGDIGTTGDTSDNCYHVFYHPNGINLDATAVLDGFTITCGNANGSDPHNGGGGMHNYSSSPTITNSTFAFNSASYGGGMNNYSSSPAITNSTFASNSAAVNGGGMYNYSSSPTMVNSIFASNSASYGGGINNFISSSPIINNSIIWGNTATTGGNQFYIYSATTTLNYSCYSNNANDVYISGGTFTATNNNITSDPLFVDAANGDFRVHGESPCVDAGLDDYNAEEFDIRGAGYLRKVNKNTGGVGTIDIGAYEYQPSADPLPVELTDFSASENKNCVNLSWQTATEVNNYGFEIQRSAVNSQSLVESRKLKDENWQKIAFVQGHGNSNSPQNYQFADTTPPDRTVQYRLKQIDFDGRFEFSDIVEVTIEAPKEFSLIQNYPNPFNPETIIEYSLPSAQVVTLNVYDMLGQQVFTLVNDQKQAGNYKVKFDGRRLASGIYIYQMRAGSFVDTKKFILLK